MAKTPVIPVAVIGMACRLPGGINTPEELWQALLRGDDLVTEVPSDRWDGDEYYDPEPGVPGRSVSKWGSFIGMAAPLLFPISSTSADELRRTAGRLAAWVADHADTVTPSDLAYTLARRRAHRPVRTAVIGIGIGYFPVLRLDGRHRAPLISTVGKSISPGRPGSADSSLTVCRCSRCPCRRWRAPSY